MSNVCFVILTLVIFTGFALGESTEEMLSSCKAVSEAKVSDTTAAFPKNFESGECWGALSALQYVSRLVDLKGQPLLPIGCVPEKTTRTQLVAIFVAYARDNPQLWHEDFVSIAMTAFKAAFQCRPK